MLRAYLVGVVSGLGLAYLLAALLASSREDYGTGTDESAQEQFSTYSVRVYRDGRVESIESDDDGAWT